MERGNVPMTNQYNEVLKMAKLPKFVLIINYGDDTQTFVTLTAKNHVSAMADSERVLKSHNDVVTARICEKTGTADTSYNGTTSQMYRAVLASTAGFDWHVNNWDHFETSLTLELSVNQNINDGYPWISTI